MKRPGLRVQWLGILVILSLVLSACTAVTPTALPSPADSGGPLTAVATYSVLGDLVQQVAGDKVQLTVLVGADGDPHVYEPAPRDAVALAEAAIVFENGLEFETWLDDLFAASGSQAARVAASNGVDALAFDAHGHDRADPHADEHMHDHDEEAGHTHAEAEAHAEDHGHVHGEFDPHTWMSPLNAIVMVENIRTALAAADPANAELYTANATAYVEELQQLDAGIRAEIETIPAERHKLVTTHELFGYFVRDYGFELLGSALGSVTTEAADPGASQIAALIEEIRSSGVPAIFVESVGNPALMERIAQETGVTVAPPLHTHGLGPAGSDAEEYLGMIRTNVQIIVEALR